MGWQAVKLVAMLVSSISIVSIITNLSIIRTISITTIISNIIVIILIIIVVPVGEHTLESNFSSTMCRFYLFSSPGHRATMTKPGCGEPFILRGSWDLVSRL